MKRENNFTRSDQIAEPYELVKEPVIGRSYHLAWAYKGARFILKEINGAKGVVYTGQTKGKMLTINIADLREIRNR